MVGECWYYKMNEEYVMLQFIRLLDGGRMQVLQAERRIRYVIVYTVAR
jgi:hypothetical protein